MAACLNFGIRGEHRLRYPLTYGLPPDERRELQAYWANLRKQGRWPFPKKLQIPKAWPKECYVYAPGDMDPEDRVIYPGFASYPKPPKFTRIDPRWALSEAAYFAKKAREREVAEKSSEYKARKAAERRMRRSPRRSLSRSRSPTIIPPDAEFIVIDDDDEEMVEAPPPSPSPSPSPEPEPELRPRSQPPQPPQPQPRVDFQQPEKEPLVEKVPEKVTNLGLPRGLPRPTFKPIFSDHLIKVNPTAAGVPLPVIKDAIKDESKQLLKTVNGVEILDIIYDDDLTPYEAEVKLHDISTQPPSHMVALCSPDRELDSDGSMKMQFYPIHDVVYHTYCNDGAEESREPGAKYPDMLYPGMTITLPVFKISIAEGFDTAWPAVSKFLYSRDSTALIRDIMPKFPTNPPEGTMNDRHAAKAYARGIGKKYRDAPDGIVSECRELFGAHKIACTLGIEDRQLWDALDWAYEAMLLAISFSVGQPDLVGPLEKL